MKKETTTSGLTYEITHKGDGARAKSGDMVAVHYTGKLSNGNVFDSSVDRGEPIAFKLGQGQVIPGWDEGISLLDVGDKATLTIPSELAYGEQGAGGVIGPNETLTFDVELVEIKDSPKPFDVSGKETVTSDSGLEYIKLNETDGEQAAANKIVTVHYSGYLEDGSLFDSSVERGQPFSFTLGQGQVVPGWDEGIGYLKIGEKAKFTVPANLAYGEQGAGGIIQPNATLVFDVELIDIQEGAKPFDVSGKEATTSDSGLQYIKLNETEGVQAEANKTVSVHYSGYLEDGSLFDSSVERGQPFSFTLGQGQVIPGWDEGIGYLRVGEKARLTVPSELAYGEQGAGGVIQPNATLIFDVELLEVS